MCPSLVGHLEGGNLGFFQNFFQFFQGSVFPLRNGSGSHAAAPSIFLVADAIEEQRIHKVAVGGFQLADGCMEFLLVRFLNEVAGNILVRRQEVMVEII